MKKLLLVICVALILGIACAGWFNRYVYPDSCFFHAAAEKTDRWEPMVRTMAGGRPIYIIAGASEGRSGVDPAILVSEYGIPAINAAMAAGFGLKVNMSLALDYARPGDVLIGSLDPALPQKISAEGMRMAWSRLGWRMLGAELLKPTVEEWLDLLVSDSRQISVYAARRLLMPERLYRYYRHTVLYESGWMEIQYTNIQSLPCPPPESEQKLIPAPPTEAFITWAQELQKTLRDRQLDLWVWYAPLMSHPAYRVQRALEALQLTRMGFNVLRDDTFNVYADGSLFSDRRFHASAKGTAMNTHKLGRLIQKPYFWTEEGLILWLKQHGYDEHGQRLPAGGAS